MGLKPQGLAAVASNRALSWQLCKAVTLILSGCMINNLVLEVIVSKKKNEFADPGAGGLMTLLQFCLVAALSTPYALRWRGLGSLKSGWSSLSPVALRPMVVPMRHYLGMMVLFFTMSYLNNWAFAFNISQPLHMVFRSSSLMVAYLIGAGFLGKKYTGKQFVAVSLLTLGAASATFAEAFLGDTATEASKRRLAASTSCLGCGGDGLSHAAAALANAAAVASTAVPSAIAALAAVVAPSSTSRALAAGVEAAGLNATIGSAMATAAGLPRPGGLLENMLGALGLDAGRVYMLRWVVGVLILTSVLVLQTLLSNYQNWSSGTYGKAPNEAMFWSHALSLPAFLLTASDLKGRAVLWSSSASTASVLAERVGGDQGAAAATAASGRVGRLLLSLLPSFVGRVPIMWTYIAINVVSQYLCITGVYHLTGMADPLTVNVALTVRKFLSLMLSIYVFGNTFTAAHWLGACLVFLGAILYGHWSSAPPAGAAAAKQLSLGQAGATATAVYYGGQNVHHRGAAPTLR